MSDTDILDCSNRLLALITANPGSPEQATVPGGHLEAVATLMLAGKRRPSP
jgi:hypothetical protein